MPLSNELFFYQVFRFSYTVYRAFLLYLYTNGVDLPAEEAVGNKLNTFLDNFSVNFYYYDAAYRAAGLSQFLL